MFFHFHQHKIDSLTGGRFLSFPVLWIKHDSQRRNRRHFVLVLRAQSLLLCKVSYVTKIPHIFSWYTGHNSPHFTQFLIINL